ncbi:hypothetical protein [Allorhodopirellula solitaria]|uniref:Uncharacterized protein n=1 Tax=Allorhodopirellula solitaria TaxID=2527987 RepID=A0A5C5XXI5_9BACT|nr:hypothetical protein [Allorhodopirellula solitaria]TWT67408.1 hypothetical protein CA85_22580 [Allorhodopirellula solitaria]
MLHQILQVVFVVVCLSHSVSAGSPDLKRVSAVKDAGEREVTVEDVRKLLLRQQLRCQPGTIGRVSLLAFDEVRNAVGVSKQTHEHLAEMVKMLQEKSHQELVQLSGGSSGRQRELTEADVLTVTKLVEGWMKEIDIQVESIVPERPRSDLLAIQFVLLGAEVFIDPAFQSHVSCSKKERADIEEERNRFLNEYFAVNDPLLPVPVPELDGQSTVALAQELTRRLTSTCDAATKHEIDKLETRGDELVSLLERLRGSASSSFAIPEKE